MQKSSELISKTHKKGVIVNIFIFAVAVERERSKP